LRRDDIDQREALNGPAIERAVADQARGKFAPDHASGAGDKNVHFVSRPRLW
jgi:hypothetical protein